MPDHEGMDFCVGLITFEGLPLIFFELARKKFFKLSLAIKCHPSSSERKSLMKKSTLVLTLLLSLYHFSSGQESLSQQRPERLFQTGLDLIAHQEYGTAYETFSEFLKIYTSTDSRRADAEYHKAFCALNLYHPDGEKQLAAFIATHKGYPKAMMAYYDLGNFFYAEKNYPKASGYYSKVDFPSLSQDQQNTGRFRWGYSLFSQRNLKDALDQFNAIKAQGGQFGPAASYYAGFIESSNGDYENALIDLKRAEANNSYSTIVPVLIANVYNQQKKDDELLKYSESVLTREDVSAADDISLMAGEAWFRKGDYKKALPLYSSYLESHDKNASRTVLYRAGYAAYVSGSDDMALRCLKGAASDADSVGAYASYFLGALYLKRQEKPYALVAYQTAKTFRKDPKMAEESLFLSAKINYDLGKPDQAITDFESFLKAYPDSPHVQEIKELLSQAYVNGNNYNKAIEYVESLVRRTPAVDRAYQKATYLKGTEYFNKEDYARAVQYFDKSLEYPIDPVYVLDASYWEGEAYSIGRRYEQAIPRYEHALGLVAGKPEMLKAIRYGLGYAHYNQQQYDKALVSFREYVAKSSASDPNYDDGVVRLADCLYVLKSYSEAVTYYKKAIQLGSPDSDYAHLQTGIILATQNKYKEAEGEFELVYKNPDSRYVDDALFQNAQIEVEQSKYNEAVDLYTRLINSSKSSRLLPYAYARRAASYYNLKKFGQTANDYISVLENYPAHPVTQDLLVPLQESLNLANRSAEFDAYLAKFKQANPDAKGIESVEFETAKNSYFNQNYTKAIENFGRYVASYPDSPKITEAKYYEAESYYRTGDFAKSLDLHQQIASDGTFSMLSRVVARIGELQFKQGKYEMAVPAFQRLAALSNNKKDQYTAWNGLMESYYLLAQYDSADAYANKILLQGNVNASAQNKASLYLGKTAMAKGDYESAKDEFLTTLNSARDEYGAEAKYSLGEIFYLTKANKECNETLLSLITEFSAYELWVGKAYLLLADNYVAMGNTFQAKGTLKSLIQNFPNQTIKDAASGKLKAIESEEKKNVQKSDTTGKG